MGSRDRGRGGRRCGSEHSSHEHLSEDHHGDHRRDRSLRGRPEGFSEPGGTDPVEPIDGSRPGESTFMRPGLSERRLYRSRTERTVAGVCGGIGEYLGLDPVIVRLVMVGLFVLGFGFVVYPVAVLIMPKEPRDVLAARLAAEHLSSQRSGDRRRHERVGRDREGRRHLFGWALLVIGVIAMADGTGFGAFSGHGQDRLALLLIAGGLVVLWQRRHRGTNTPEQRGDSTFGAPTSTYGSGRPGGLDGAHASEPAAASVIHPNAAPVGGDAPTDIARAAFSTSHSSAGVPSAPTRDDLVAEALAELYHPVEDELAASTQSFAADMRSGSVVTPPPPPQPLRPPTTRVLARPRRRVVGPVALGTMCIAVGVLTILGWAGVPLPGARTLTAAALLWVAGALILGSWFGRPRGFIALGLLLSIALAAQTVLVGISGGVGRRGFVASTPGELSSRYRLGMGTLSLDLRALRIPGRRARVGVELGAGTIAIALPSGPTAPKIVLTGEAQAGIIVINGTDRDGLGVVVRETLNPTANPGAGVLELDLRLGAGETEVTTGAFRDLELVVNPTDGSSASVPPVPTSTPRR